MTKVFNKVVIIMLLLYSCSLWADTLVMKDGSVLKGNILKQEKNALNFKTSYAGTLNIKWDQVKSFQTDEITTIMLVTDELVKTRYVNNSIDGITQVKKEGEEWRTAFKSANVSYINPDPWRLGKGYKFSGRANFSLKSQHGNTIKDELELDGDLEFRSLLDRYTLKGAMENDNSNGTKTADNWMLNGKYDYFVKKQQYYGIMLSLERDKFTDLKLRTTVGPHAGYQFFESKAVNLRSEGGLAKVYESRFEADDQDYLALNWYINYDQYFFSDFTQFYHEQRGIWDIENSNKITFTQWTGFRFPLRSGIVASAEVELEYDSQPKDSVGKSDMTYRLKIGYQW